MHFKVHLFERGLFIYYLQCIMLPQMLNVTKSLINFKLQGPRQRVVVQYLIHRALVR